MTMANVSVVHKEIPRCSNNCLAESLDSRAHDSSRQFLSVFLLQAEPERMKGSIVLSRCIGVCGWGRAHVLEYFKFTTSLTGRGLFYIFLGLLVWTEVRGLQCGNTP